MVSWNSIYLEVAYSVLGWISFFSWSLCFYPQVLLNYRRKSVVGYNFDFPTLNLTKHTSYLIYNAALFFSPEVQSQYHDKYGPDQMIPVGLNDVFFSIHALSLTAFTLFQIFIYEVVMNFKRKSTVGWSIGFVFFDFFGGLFSFGQMCAQSIDQGSTVNFYGNTGKLLLSLEVILFDLLFIVQHYVLYPEERDKDNVVTIPGEREPFIGSSRMEGMKVSTSKDEDTGTDTNNLMIVAVAETSGQG
ncbi:cystinosin homolog isoform X5 [Carex rostrata]